MKPLAVDLCAGLGGWTDGLLLEGWDVVGFDIERHHYGEAKYPAQLVLQDILTIDGRQFRGHVSLIVASPPCQKYSFMAMPWRRAKDLARWYRDPEHPERIVELNALFNACFRIAREAECPLVLENVRGAQPWVGRSRWSFGSFHLWGDVPALMPMTKRAKVGGFSWSDYGKPDYKPMAFNGEADRRLREDTKNNGGSWFAVAHNTTSGHGQNPDGRKMPDGDSIRSDKGRSAALQHYDQLRDLIQSESGVKGFTPNGEPLGKNTLGRKHGSRSKARKAASALIAKIPLTLSRHIARAWYPA